MKRQGTEIHLPKANSNDYYSFGFRNDAMPDDIYRLQKANRHGARITNGAFRGCSV